MGQISPHWHNGKIGLGQIGLGFPEVTEEPTERVNHDEPDS